MFVVSLSPAQVAEVAAGHHQLWGQQHSLAQYRAHLVDQLAQSGGRMSYCGWVQDGHVCCSLKRYALRFAHGGRTVDMVGIGAVFTPPQHRGRAFAAQLLGSVVGSSPALLFSDIDPAFYQRLGFARCAAASFACDSDDLPSGQPLSLVVCDDAARLVGLRDRLWCSRGRLERDACGWRYWYWRNGPLLTYVLSAAERAVGFVSLRRTNEVLLVEDAGVETAFRERFWSTLRLLARQASCSSVRGWFPPELVSDCWQRSDRSACIPMVANLAGDAHFWGAERF